MSQGKTRFLEESTELVGVVPSGDLPVLPEDNSGVSRSLEPANETCIDSNGRPFFFFLWKVATQKTSVKCHSLFREMLLLSCFFLLSDFWKGQKLPPRSCQGNEVLAHPQRLPEQPFESEQMGGEHRKHRWYVGRCTTWAVEEGRTSAWCGSCAPEELPWSG